METQYKVLCVCLGNICRSPTAEVVLDIIVTRINSMLLSIQLERVIIIQINRLISVVSCMPKRGYDLSSLRARQLSTQDF